MQPPGGAACGIVDCKSGAAQSADPADTAKRRPGRSGFGAAPMSGRGARGPRERGYAVISDRTWTRIRIEYTAGASAAWLSARYGPAERTIAARAKKGRWRKIDVARARDAEEEAREAAEAARREPGGEPGREPGGEPGADVWTDEGIDDGADEGAALDLDEAVRLSQTRAVAALRRGDARAAQEFLKLARMLAGAADEEGSGYRPSAQDEAALAFVLERLEAQGE